jgi:hypothetical protein
MTVVPVDQTAFVVFDMQQLDEPVSTPASRRRRTNLPWRFSGASRRLGRPTGWLGVRQCKAAVQTRRKIGAS